MQVYSTFPDPQFRPQSNLSFSFLSIRWWNCSTWRSWGDLQRKAVRVKKANPIQAFAFHWDSQSNFLAFSSDVIINDKIVFCSFDLFLGLPILPKSQKDGKAHQQKFMDKVCSTHSIHLNVIVKNLRYYFTIIENVGYWELNVSNLSPLYAGLLQQRLVTHLSMHRFLRHCYSFCPISINIYQLKNQSLINIKYSKSN